MTDLFDWIEAPNGHGGAGWRLKGDGLAPCVGWQVANCSMPAPPIPLHVASEQWARPMHAARCAHAARPRIFVILTATVQPFVNLHRRGMGNQQRNPSERRALYAEVVRRWATESNVTIVFAENSGADLAPFEAQVPQWRRGAIEFFSVERQSREAYVKSAPPGAKYDVGRLEAQAIVDALNRSALLAQRCPNDLVFKVTGRYFIHEFERTVRDRCLRRGNAHGADGASGLPLILHQQPDWEKQRGPGELETMCMGFAARFALAVLGWAVTPPARTLAVFRETQVFSERRLAEVVNRMARTPSLSGRVCPLGPLPVMPVREGSSGVLRSSI